MQWRDDTTPLGARSVTHCLIRCSPEAGGWNRVHLILDDLPAEVARLRTAGTQFAPPGSCHDATFPRPANSDRLAPKFRIVALFHRRIERVHVNVNDLPWTCLFESQIGAPAR